MAEDPVGDLVKHLTPAKAAPVQTPSTDASAATAPPPVQTPQPVASTNAAAPPPAATPEGSFWSLYGPGWGSSQQLGDFTTVAGSNFPLQPAVQRFGSDVLGIGSRPDFVRLKADADAARRRLGPAGSLGADAVATYTNPAAPLNVIPYVGPGLATGIQQGVKSYGEGKDLPTVGVDAGKGFAAGETSLGLAHTLTSPTVGRFVGQRAVDVGVPTALSGLLGLHLGYPEVGAGLGFGGSLVAAKDSLLRGAAEKAGEGGAWVAGHLPTRAVQMGLSGLYPVLGRGGAYDNWIPGQ